jgi:hypothetical protein
MPTPAAIAIAGENVAVSAVLCTATVPRSARTRPNATRMSVDLPAPFSPSRACTVPARTSSVTSCSARTAPNCLWMPRSESASGWVTGRSVARRGRAGT